jgi:hypothetical protein
VEVRRLLILLEDKVVRILFQLGQKPKGKHVLVRVARDGVFHENEGVINLLL